MDAGKPSKKKKILCSLSLFLPCNRGGR
jgi:hypothetical protein